MANGKIQIRDGAANALYPRVRTTDIMNGDVNISIFDENDVIRPQFIPGSVDEILPFTSTVTGTTVPAVEQDSAAHYINTTSKTIYGTMFNGTSYVWAPAQNLTGAALYTSGGKLYRWTGTAMAVIDQAIASTTTVRTTGAVNTLVPTEAAVATAIANAVTAGNTNLVSSVKGANGLTQNGSQGNVIISGIDAKGDSSTKGVVITTSAITSNAGGNSNVVPTMNAIYTALAGKQAAGNYATSAQLTTASSALNTAIGTKAAANHNHDTVYAAISHNHAIADVTGLQTALDGKASTGHTHDFGVTKIVAGKNITLSPNTGVGEVTISATDTNTNLVSSVKGANGLTQNGSTGNIIISGVNAKGDGTTVGVVVTSNAIVSTTSTNAATGTVNAAETSYIVPTMRAIWNMSSTLNAAIGTKQAAGNYATSAQLSAASSALTAAIDTKQAAGNYATSAQLLNASSALNAAIGGKANTAHSHTIAQVTNLQTTLDGKAAANHNHDTIYAPIAHSHAVADITDFAANVISAQQSTVVAPGANVTVTSSVEGNVITYAVSGQKNTNLVSSVSGTNGLTQNSTTGKVIISGVNATGTSTGVGVVATLNAITSGVAGGTSFVVPTMQAVWNMSSTLNAKADNDHITSVVSGNAGIKVTSTINGTTVTYQVSNLVTNTNLVSSVTGYNGLSANPTTGVVKVSGVDTTGNGTTKGVVATTKTITSVATSGDTFVTPTVNAVWVSCLFYTAID